MFERFDSDRSRYASLGVVSSLPSGLIDSIWLIIHFNLHGDNPLNDSLPIDMLNNNAKGTVPFSQENSSVQMAIDVPFSYSTAYPSRIFAFDDGHRETILLPAEMLES